MVRLQMIKKVQGGRHQVRDQVTWQVIDQVDDLVLDHVKDQSHRIRHQVWNQVFRARVQIMHQVCFYQFWDDLRW